ETIRNLEEMDVPVKLDPLADTSKSAISYGITMGVFQEIGLSTDPCNKEGSTYLAPQRVKKEDVWDFIKRESMILEDYFEYISEKISKKVLKQEQIIRDDKIYELFTYVVRELVRNIFDHSGSEYFCYGSQFKPKTKEVE